MKGKFVYLFYCERFRGVYFIFDDEDLFLEGPEPNESVRTYFDLISSWAEGVLTLVLLLLVSVLLVEGWLLLFKVLLSLPWTDAFEVI